MALLVPTAWLALPKAMPDAISFLILNALMRTGPIMLPVIPVIITERTVSDSIPPRFCDTAIAIGVVMLFGIRRYKKRALFYTVLSFVLLYLFAYLVKNDILYPGVPKDSYVVLKMFDGSLLNYLFPEMTLTPMIETMTTVGLLLIAFLLSLGLYFANQKFFKGKEENILECGIYPWLKKYSADEDEIRR